jgi:nucleotide-binding universal stress UspA family protein
VSHIIVGIDGSSESRYALDWALTEGARTGQRVTAVLVWQLPTLPPLPLDLGMQAGFWEGLPEMYRTMAADELASGLARIRLGIQVASEALATAGDPGTTLVSLSEGAALLVVGTRARSGLSRGVLGSVTAYCLHHSNVPVAVVPHQGSFHSTTDLPFLVGVDSSDSALAALRWAAAAAQLQSRRLVVLHAADPGNPDAAPSPVAPVQDWVEGVLGAERARSVQVVTERGPAASVLLAHAELSDRIIVGAHRRGGFARLLLGSVSSHTALHASCPVIVVRPSETAAS